MEKCEMIHKLIGKIVLYFNENEVTIDMVKKISSMKQGDVIIDGDSIRCVTDGIVREVSIDTKNKSIDMKTFGEKITYNRHSNFSNEIRYYENGIKCYCNKDNVNNELTQLENKTIISSDLYKSTIIIKNGRRIFTGIVKSDKYAEKNKYGEYIVVRNDNSKKDFYLLANGDILKIVNKNDKERYFYCDSSVMSRNQDNKSNNRFDVELSYKDAEKILKNFDNSFYLINNDVVFNIRGRVY